ncbi:MAG: biotin carboxylase N-terminal domain-containing protein [Candidatus Korobacteraceae bacterium]|jgi:acetyl/propionyl-CoA carboxylase alpha subunit/acetyl-CoA carboxylase carboxyltransferase component
MEKKFERVAIVNRGEAAMRFIHAAREFNQEHGTALRTIALFTDPDRHAMFVRQADEAISLGPPQIADPNTNHLKSCYVDYAHLERALRKAQAEAVWVGWGFVAEHAQFADLCREMGIVFIGPDGDVMRRLGDKISSKRLAEQAQIPVADWSGGPVETLSEAWRQAERLGYPVFIKATAGGGGHGIRRVQSPGDFETAFGSARAEAFKAFGDPTVFLEQVITGARHIEVQIIADHCGTTWAAGVRDCTIQRRQQKILEEAPSPALNHEQDQELRRTAVRLSQAARYHNAGTVEFLYEPKKQRFVFMEMNTRLQVEHPVTECTTGLDLVKLQIHVARGGRLEGDPPATIGHAIEVRLNAEDPNNGFAPSPGVIERFRMVTGPGVRIDTGVEEGDTIPAEFDSMIAKIIAFGQNRHEALARLQRVLHESVVVIKGGVSNRAFLLDLLGRDEVQSGNVDIGWMDRLATKGQHISRQHLDVALVMAAIKSYESELRVEHSQFYASALRGRPQVRSEIGHTVELRYCDNAYSMNVYRMGLRQYRIEVDGSSMDAQIEPIGPYECWLTVFGQRFHVVAVEQGSSFRMEMDGVSHRIDRDNGGVVRAPSPAVVVSIAVKPGDRVSTGDRLAVLEAMKMETQVIAPFPGRIRQVMTIPNVQVSTGDPLLQIEPDAAQAATESTERVKFGASLATNQDGQPADSRWRQNLDELRQLMLGFDVSPERTSRLVAEWKQLAGAESDDDQVRGQEDEILNIFVDLWSLFRRKPIVSQQVGSEAPSTEAYLFSYLRMLDTHGEGLPPDFVKALKRALAHYGITALDRSPELEECLLWIYKSHQKAEQQIAPVLCVLQRRLAGLTTNLGAADEALRTLLDRMVSITRELFPSVSDLARELRYRCFEQPSFAHARKQVYASIEEHLDYLAAHPDAPDLHQRMRALVDCPQPLASLLAGRFPTASPGLRQIMMEAVTSRYYLRRLTNFRTLFVNGHCFATAQYEEDHRRLHVFMAYAEYPLLDETMRALFPFLVEVPPDEDIVLDFFTWKQDSLSEAERTQTEVSSVISSAAFPRTIRRVVVAVSGAAGDPGMGAMQHFTYEPFGDGYKEVELFRGVHPMMGERLHLWRLANFKIDRLPSVEDVYLLHAVANGNPKDERLFAVAEVRDLTPVRDKWRRIVQLPYLERMFTEAIAAIRQFQMKRTPRERLYWNRIFLYVWPTLNLRPEEVNDIVHRLAPLADGVGLEQVVVRMRIPNPRTGELRDTVMRISAPGEAGMLITFRPASKLQPMKPLTTYDQKVVKMRQRGLLYPFEIVRMLTSSPNDTRADFPPGEFVEHDLDAEGRLIPVHRPYGQNTANIIAGVLRNFTDKYPEGMKRVVLLGDPSKDLGALAEPECARILAALKLAQAMQVPLEWFTLSAGAKISMNSGVENMDWIARVLRAIVDFTQAGGEINLIVNGINVGAQPYWNAEATMLMHTRGILIMTPRGAMVLTGKKALDYSGSVSAEDNQGIGGYDRIMGFNGQAQYFARDIDEACQILLQHYEHTYVMPGERFPRRAPTSDPPGRDVQLYPHGDGNDEGFTRIGEIFSDETNAGRKNAFEIRSVMMAVADQDHTPLERWPGMRSAETAVVWDAHLGGYPVCLLGIESKPVPRFGFVPADGPDYWTAGTLFPLSSKKVARAINSASNNRPVVVLANLSGFDGSPESMRRLQLEYGAEIGRAVVNFKGPMVFCVVSRYHGGAYVVFSRALNEQLEVIALEGTYASVIGGAPAAAVVFAGEVDGRARKDPRMEKLSQAIAQAEGAEKNRLRTEWNELFQVVHSEKLGEMAAEFDRIHSVHRALEVGALHRIIPPRELRPYLIEAIARGIAKEEASRSVKKMVSSANLLETRVPVLQAD